MPLMTGSVDSIDNESARVGQLPIMEKAISSYAANHISSEFSQPWNAGTLRAVLIELGGQNHVFGNRPGSSRTTSLR